MSRSYDVTALATVDPTDSTWALANARRFLRDTPNEVGSFVPRSFLDAELVAQLELDSVVFNAVTYYRPHVTAGALLKANPERVLSFSGGGYSEAYSDPERLARAILQAGAGIDNAINDLAGSVIVSSARVARVVF
jgi:hypothetical protein